MEQGHEPTESRDRAPARDAERVLRRRAAELARPLARPRGEDEAVPVLELTAGSERYAIALEAVVRVEAVERVARVPGAPPHVVGVVALGGRPCPLVDVPALLGVAGVPAAARRWAVVLGRARPVLALAADAVAAGRLAKDALRPSDGAGPRLGVTPDARIVLDAAALLASAEPRGGAAP